MKLAFALLSFLLGATNAIVAAALDNADLQLNHPNTNDHHHLQDDIFSFQLKMYWEEGYYWQEEDFERPWCAECQGSKCEEGDLLHIKKCDNRNRNDQQRFVYEEVPGSGGGRIKPYTAQDLCWTSLGADRGRFELMPCDNNCRQIIVGIQYEERFEMNPLGRPEDCLEQHHHPRRNEVIRAKDCEQSRKDTTSYWVMINKQGDEKTTDTSSSALYGDCSPHVPPSVSPPTDPPTTATVATTSTTAAAATTVAPPDTTVATVAPPNTTVAATTVVPPKTTLSIVATPTTIPPTRATTTTATTIAPPKTTTIAASSTPAPKGSCELDDNDLFGQESSHATSLGYFYELVTDPAALVDSNIEDIIGDVGRNVLNLLLPKIFGDDCNVDEGQRKLANMAVGVKVGPAESVEGATCTGQFAEGHNCIVVAASMTVYTNGEVQYDTLLLPVLRAALNSGLLNNADPAVVKVSYLAEPGNIKNSSTPKSASDGGINDTTKLIVAVSAGAAALIVGIVALIVVATKFRRKQRLQSVNAVTDGATPPTCEVKEPIGTVYLSELSLGGDAPTETRERPNVVGPYGPRAEDGRDFQPELPTRAASYIDV